MYETKVGRAYGRGCLLQLVVGVVGGAFGIAMVATVLYLIDGGRVAPRSGRLALALAVPYLFMAVPILGGIAFVWWRGKRFDRMFAPWRLRGRQHGAGLRGWHGEVLGRRLDAWIARGPTLELYVACRPATRAALHRGGPLIRAVTRILGERTPMEPSPIDLDGVNAVAEDEAWLRRLLEDSQARAAVHTLMDDTPRAATAVFVSPDAVRYVRRFLPRSELVTERVGAWHGALTVLAEAVDRLGPSGQGAEPTRLESWARTARGRYQNRVLAGLGCFFVLSMVLLFAFGWWNVGTP